MNNMDMERSDNNLFTTNHSDAAAAFNVTARPQGGSQFGQHLVSDSSDEWFESVDVHQLTNTDNYLHDTDQRQFVHYVPPAYNGGAGQTRSIFRPLDRFTTRYQYHHNQQSMSGQTVDL